MRTAGGDEQTSPTAVPRIRLLVGRDRNRPDAFGGFFGGFFVFCKGNSRKRMKRPRKNNV